MPTTKTDYSRYTKATSTVKQRIIWAGFGEPGSGKTTFGLTAPGPIVVFSLDQGLEGVVEPFTATKDIYVKEYDWAPMPGDNKQEEAQALRDQFTEDFEHACHHARTVIIDKETDVWSLFKYAEFGPPEKGRPDDWEELKRKVRRLINMPKPLDINFGVIQGMKNEWISQVNPKTGAKGITQSGVRVRAGMDDIEALVHINIEHVRERVVTDGVVESRFAINVGKSRGPGSPAVQDQTFYNLTFPEFAGLVFPDSTEQDWL